MTTQRLPTDPPIEVTLRRSARAKRFSLRVSRLDGRVTLSMPHWAPEAEALAFARSKADWVQAILTKSAGARLRAGEGTSVMFEGRDVTIRQRADVRSVHVAGDLMLVPLGEVNVGLRVQAYLKLSARQRLQQAVDHYAAALDRPYTAITLRDTRSRWGSCTTDGRLMFSWRLIMAPPDVLAYVAAHEVAHLAEMNHSPAFWAVVGRLMPDYRHRRSWLRQNGAMLHKVGFSD